MERRCGKRCDTKWKLFEKLEDAAKRASWSNNLSKGSHPVEAVLDVRFEKNVSDESRTLARWCALVPIPAHDLPMRFHFHKKKNAKYRLLKALSTPGPPVVCSPRKRFRAAPARRRISTLGAELRMDSSFLLFSQASFLFPAREREPVMRVCMRRTRTVMNPNPSPSQLKESYEYSGGRIETVVKREEERRDRFPRLFFFSEDGGWLLAVPAPCRRFHPILQSPALSQGVAAHLVAQFDNSQ
ncbi:hypothetical protein B0T10DRAFT_452468 [Thelonectria olida]|uniref:Uncharacterized protein n=1 Tax=Thelonectria olida TaxID=1576542 RepID=A0A9P8WLG3_9HYPO|nr:hypothetical protein B0T10DRAFT_452468 [Thelonectria olida]